MSSNELIEDVIKSRPPKTKRATYTISEDILDKFNKIAKLKNFNKSKIVENFLKKIIESEESLI